MSATSTAVHQNVVTHSRQFQPGEDFSRNRRRSRYPEKPGFACAIRDQFLFSVVSGVPHAIPLKQIEAVNRKGEMRCAAALLRHRNVGSSRVNASRREDLL